MRCTSRPYRYVDVQVSVILSEVAAGAISKSSHLHRLLVAALKSVSASVPIRPAATHLALCSQASQAAPNIETASSNPTFSHSTLYPTLPIRRSQSSRIRSIKQHSSRCPKTVTHPTQFKSKQHPLRAVQCRAMQTIPDRSSTTQHSTSARCPRTKPSLESPKSSNLSIPLRT